MADSHISKQGEVGQVHLNVWATIIPRKEVAGLDARLDIQQTTVVGKDAEYGVVSLVDGRTGAIRTAQRMPAILAGGRSMTAGACSPLIHRHRHA
jgi:hypothetical protein